MKNIACIVFLLSGLYGTAQTTSNSIVGKWLKTPKEDLVIEVSQSGDEYIGKIAWSRDSSVAKGYQILEGLSFNEEKSQWSGGTIHNPSTDASYKANAKILPDGQLEVLAYKGMKFIGKKKYFKRVE